LYGVGAGGTVYFSLVMRPNWGTSLVMTKLKIFWFWSPDLTVNQRKLKPNRCLVLVSVAWLGRA
jgi:hypothetical protein